jgi:Pectate lyase superfamily protein
LSNARSDFGAVGDGVTDDTEALRTAFARSNSVTFLPFGTYAVRAGALVLGCNASVVGEALSTIALFAGAAPSGGPGGELLALLATPADATCSATLIDLSLSTLGTGNDGAVLLDHQAGAGSYVCDVTMRIVYSVGLKARLGRVGGAPGTGAGQLSNTWFWGQDHNLTDMGEMDCVDPSCVDHRPPGQVRGVSIATSGPLFMLATNFEHSNETEYLLEPGAANVVGSVIQTEGSLVSLNISRAAGPIVFFGGLFGSGSGHNATLYAERGPRGAACAGGVDVSYRLLGAMVKQPLNFSLVDSTPGGRGFAARAPASGTGWELGSFVNSC